jgi:lipopolysaccharide transport system permease protein
MGRSLAVGAPIRGAIVDELLEMVRHRELLRLLVAKELKIKYKGTALGMVWSLLNPLLMMLVYTVVFSVIARFQVHNYPIFLLSGLLPWNALAGAITSSSISIIINGHLVRRVKFPREFLPLSSVGANLFNLLPSLAVLVVLALAFRQPLGWPLVTLPLLLVLQALFSVGIALILAAVTVYFRDVEYLVGIGTTIWFFATPVIYPVTTFSGHRFGALLWLNPMTWLITSYQHVWHENTWPDLQALLAFAAVSVLLCLVGAAIFGRLQRRFAEEV